MDSKGLLLCARYSSAPNFFGYCGPEENSSLIDHLKDKVADSEVEMILSQFDTLYSYLKLISTENKILDPFDQKVVEAYWIGNSLLDNISNRDYAYLLQEELDLERKMERIKFRRVKAKILSKKFYPHHAFHVFNIFKRTGHVNSNYTLDTMDQCRISFGKLKTPVFAKASSGKQNSKRETVIVRTKQLANSNPSTTSTSLSTSPLRTSQQLVMGKVVEKELKIDYKGKVFLKDLKPGDWVSFHWGFVCDVLTEQQVRNLEFYTQKAIDFYNQ